VDFVSIDLTCEGTVDRRDGATHFTEIVLRPRLTLTSETDCDLALRAVHKSERACLVSASLSTPIRVEPELVVAEEAAALVPTR